MRNRWGQDIKRGQTVRVHLPRGGFEVGEIIKVTREAGGSYLTLESGRTASIDDVHQIVAEHPVTRRKSNPLTRVKVNSPSMRTKEAPSSRLKTRRKKTARAPEGYYANPGKRTRAQWAEEIAKLQVLVQSAQNRDAYDYARWLYDEAMDDYSKAADVAQGQIRRIMDSLNEERYGGRKMNPLSRVKVNSPSMLTKEPPSARLKARRRKTAKAPAGVYANPAPSKLWTVHRADANGKPVYHIAHFRKQSDAKQYAQAYADANGTRVVITGKAL